MFLILAFEVERTQLILGLSVLSKDSSSASLDFIFRAILNSVAAQFKRLKRILLLVTRNRCLIKNREIRLVLTLESYKI